MTNDDHQNGQALQRVIKLQGAMETIAYGRSDNRRGVKDLQKILGVVIQLEIWALMNISR